ncbi:pre-mRNA-splicing factor Brr1p [Monosporozyma unispora]
MSVNFDPLFGQSKVFSTEDANVNPDVIAYLNSVRNEALTTSAISMSAIKEPEIDLNVRHDASMYDDDCEPTTKKIRESLEGTSIVPNAFPDNLINFHQRLIPVMEWFELLKRDIKLQQSNFNYHYDKISLDLLLWNIKQVLDARNLTNENKGVSLHIMNLLKDWTPSVQLPKVNDFEIDEEWVETLLLKLKCVKIPNITFLKSFITGDYSFCEPRGFRAWNQFLLNNEPCKDMFMSMINSNNIWLLVKYMAQTWINQISSNESHKLTLWLLYLLMHLPHSVVANNTSTLRDLGKKCREIISEYYWKQQKEEKEEVEGEEPVVPLAILPEHLQLEYKQFICKPPPPETSLLELTLYIIATRYGQLDLLEWED